jgi:hypothetical protein
MIKGLLLSVCVFLSLYLLYDELAPAIQDVVVRVDNTISRTARVDRPTAIKWLKVVGFGLLVIMLVRDAITAFRLALKSGQEPNNPEDEIGPRLRVERARRRKALLTANSKEHRGH